MLRSHAVRGSLGVLGASVVGLFVLAENDEGTKRSLVFWGNVFPIFAHYRSIQFLNRDLKILSDTRADKIYEELHEKYTDRVRDLTYRLRGFYLKQAQLMSMQDHFVPKAYMKWVKNTQDNLPSEFVGDSARKYVRKLLLEEQNRNFDDVFSSWDDKPLGVASIGEVHKAVLKNGKVVAVKILVPGIEAKFRSDTFTIRSFCQLALPQHVTAIEETQKQFLTEFDYVEEARNLEQVRVKIMPRFKGKVEIPQAYTELCSKNILVMEFLDGVKLVDGIKEELSRYAVSINRTLDDLEQERKELIDSGKFQFFTIDEEKTRKQNLRLVTFLFDACCTANPWRFLYNYSILRLVYGPAKYYKSPLPPDLGEILDLLCRIQASQLFEDGFFNGDAHPGNILKLKNGKLGLIDFGQMKRLTIEERIVYAKLIVAHARKDVKEVVRYYC